MRIDKLAVTAQEALQNAISIAADMEAAAVEPEHLLKALLDSNEGNLTAIIERIGADPRAIDIAITEDLEKQPKVSGTMPNVSQRLAAVVDDAVKIADLAFVLHILSAFALHAQRLSVLRVPAGTQDGKTLRVKGKGAQDVKNKGKVGDLKIKVIVQMPKNLNAEQKKAIEAFRDASPSPDALRPAITEKVKAAKA